jgi:cytochrome b6-f complex iron-sulfur subunit
LRRELLQSLGVAAAGALVVAAGCQQQGGSALPTATVSSCSNGQCIDLGDANNQDLTAAGGAMLIDAASDTIMVIRISDTQVLALSAICTHAGCSMDYLPSQRLLDCPCHGSQFSTDGAVTRGPAQRALRVYSATVSNNTITINA